MSHVDDEFLGLFEDLSDGDDDPDGPLLRDFLEHWEAAATPAGRDAVLGEYVSAHPRIAERFHEHVAATKILSDATAHHPARLGPYRIVRLLACGGMGNVYEAEEELLGRHVAVKTIRVGRAADERSLDRFERERRALAHLHHTHIVPIFGAGEDDGLLYFAMPLIKGFSLADLVATMSRRRSSHEPDAAAPGATWDDILSKASSDAVWRKSLRRVSADRVASSTGTYAPAAPRPPAVAATPSRPPLTPDYFRQVARVVAVAAEALHSAHDVGVLHLDVKPSNVLLERDHDPKAVPHRAEHTWVIDFGLADTEAAGNGRGGVDDGGQSRARATSVFGTRGYMTPEMLKRGVASGDGLPPLDRRSDVWGLGVTLYQLLTLRMPFAGDDEVMDLDRAPAPPRALVTGLPRELEAVVLKALAKRPADRYQTAAAFAADLRRWLDGFPTAAGAAGLLRAAAMWSRRRPAAAFAAGMTAAFAIVSLLGAGQIVRIDRAEAAAAKAETATARAEARAAEQEVEAKRRELDLIAVPRMRAPVRSAAWAEKAWSKTRELAGGRPDGDGRFQGEFAALLEGLDARLAKTFAGGADMLAFSPDGKRLLMGKFDPGLKVTRLIGGHLAGQEGQTEVTLQGSGAVRYRPDRSPRFLQADGPGLSLIRLKDGLTVGEKQPLKSPSAGHSAVIASTLSADGSRAAGVVWPLRERLPKERAGSGDGADAMTPAGDTATLVVWDVDTQLVVRAIQAKQSPNHDVALSPDGSRLASWRADGHGGDEVAVWSVDDGALIGRFRSSHNGISGVAFGRDPFWRDDGKSPGWRMAVGERGGRITVWDLRSQAVKSIAAGSEYGVNTLDFSHDGSLLASAGRAELRVWDPATGECLLTVPAGNYQLAVTFSPDDRLVVVGKMAAFTFPEGVDVFSLERGRGLKTLRGLQQRVEKVVVSPDGRRVAALSNDWEVGVWDKESGSLLGVADGPGGIFPDNAALAFNADGTRLVCSGGTEVKLWDVEGRRVLRMWELPPALTEAAGFRADGRLVLVRQETKGRVEGPFREADPKHHPRVCRVYELPEAGAPDQTAEIFDFDHYVESIAGTPDAAYFAIQGISRAAGKPARLIHLYEGSSGKRVGSIPTAIPPTDRATHMRFDPKGTRLQVCVREGQDGVSEVFEVPSLLPAGGRAHPKCINVGASRWISALSERPDTPPSLVLYEQSRPAPLLRLVRDVPMSGADGIKFTPDGNHVVCGNRDGTVTVCDLNEVQRRLAGVGLGW